MPTSNGKPEGIDVVALTAGNRGSCGSTADYAVLVSDYCANALYVYALDLKGTSSVLTYMDAVNLNTGSVLAGNCQPSSVRYHAGSGKAFMTCQTRESILRIEMDDLCNPAAAFESEAVLTFAEPESIASCSSAGTPTLYPCNPDAQKCAPHNIEFDEQIAPGWLFINLTEANQSLVVRRTNLAVQAALYKQNGSKLEPLEAWVGSTP